MVQILFRIVTAGFFGLLVSFGFTSCATAGRINDLEVGMTKPQVYKVLGKPEGKKASANEEVLVYHFYDTDNAAFAGVLSEYWVILREGKVVQFGKPGDYGSTSLPAQNINLNVHSR